VSADRARLRVQPSGQLRDCVPQDDRDDAVRLPTRAAIAHSVQVMNLRASPRSSSRHRDPGGSCSVGTSVIWWLGLSAPRERARLRCAGPSTAPGQDRIGAHSEGPELHRQGFSSDHCTLSRRSRARGRYCEEPEVEEVRIITPERCAFISGAAYFAKKEGAVEIDGKAAPPLGQGRYPRRSAGPVIPALAQSTSSCPSRREPPHELGHRGARRQRRRVAPPPRRACCERGLVDVGDPDLRAFGGEASAMARPMPLGENLSRLCIASCSPGP